MKLKLKYKILLLYIVISAGILILIGGIFSSKLKTIKFDTIQSGFQNQLTHIDFALTSFFQGVAADLKGIASNEQVRSRNDENFTNFTEADEKTFQYNIGRLEREIIDIFNRYRTTHKFANSVYMGRENGSFVRSHKRNRPTKYDPRLRPWYVLGKNNPGKIMRTAPYRSVTSSDINIGNVTSLLDDQGQFYGVVGIDVTLADLTKYIENVKVGRNGYMVLIDKGGTFLASRNEHLRFQNVKAIYKGNLRTIFENHQGFTTLTKESTKNYLFFYTSPELDWKLGIIIPVEEIESEVRNFVSRIILALVIALLLLSILTLLGLQKFVIKPLKQLTNATNHITRTGNLDLKINIQSKDEIGHLASSFNQMISTLHTSESALKASEIELRKHRDHLEELVEERTAELKENQERLALAEERSRMLLESAGEGIFGVGKDGLMNFINPAGLAMLGFEAQELVGQKIHPIIHHTRSDGTPYPIEECPMHHTLTQGTIGKRDDEILWRKDGTYFPVEYTSVPIRKNGFIAGSVVVFSDITERKHMEAELVQAKHAADEANKAKSDFLANMSHEIRTPMNAVIGMTHLALKTELTPKQRDYLAKIQSSANSLLGIINDILDFSKIEAGKLDMEAVDFNLEDVLDNLANLITVKTQEKKELEVLFFTAQDVPRFLIGDPLRLGQILINLANNAVKFTESGEIVVSTELVNQVNGRVTLKFSVSDTGIGLTQKQMQGLFEAFSQADISTTRKYGGTGLGLTISKRLVEMMAGEIWVQSKSGQGSTFSFTATFELGREKEKRRRIPGSDLENLNVLVVDDNVTSRQILQDMLESFSFKVTQAASAEEGLEEVEKASNKKPFDLVVMDWKMPGMDGIEASRRIKNHPHLSKIPAVVLVTAYGREEIMQKAERAGFEGILLKPVSPSVLLDTIVNAFGEEMPKHAQAVRESDQEADRLTYFQGARVLLVEDNEINQQVAREILEGAGIDVALANDGQQAVDAVKENEFDAVLMDVQMPVMDGYTATRKIREWETEVRRQKTSNFEARETDDLQASSDQKPATRGQRPIPIIAMTAHAMAGDREVSLDAGMDDHVAKPIDPNQLFAALHKWIRSVDDRGQPRQLQADISKEAVPRKLAKPFKPAPKTVDEDSLPQTLSGFDLSSGLQRLQGNQRLYKKLLQDFAANYAAVASEIKKALDTSDMDQVHSLVHNLKGVTGNLAAIDLHAAAIEMEKMIKRSHKKKVPSQEQLNLKLTELENALNHTFESVQSLGPAVVQHAAEPSEDLITSLPTELAQDAAKRIRDAADMGNVSQLKSIAAELTAKSEAFSPIGQKIIHLAEEFDFDGIVQLANNLEKKKDKQK
jgi:PAS domain S-box-containing protein